LIIPCGGPCPLSSHAFSFGLLLVIFSASLSRFPQREPLKVSPAFSLLYSYGNPTSHIVGPQQLGELLWEFIAQQLNK